MKAHNLILKHSKFLQWKERIEANGNIIKKINVVGEISRDRMDFFCVLIDVILLTGENKKIPRCVLLGGESVVVVPVMTCSDDNKVYTLMVEQRRIVDGDFAVEFPAGSIDSTTDDPKTVACQEIKEELNMDVVPDELLLLSNKRVKTNPSFSDSLVYYYYFERNFSMSELKKMEGKKTGENKHNEYIRVRLKKMSEVSMCMTSSALIGIKLLEEALGRHF